ncbi:acyltransferase [Chryseobacterium formosus]|uniref:Acyltransferase n=1 Tax=Chryseobacterium formosus TaxID=1537363 RepID=A0ABT3XN36_9FLAO|nr:DapH/DapD/GlmU-related protein [Chryseobacterium formosus]MCX8522345.1 acyltransferase [Chryseobacterium formosus]
MIYFYRLIIKVNVIIKNLLKKATLETAKRKGLRVGKNLYIEGIPNFGSEPFLVEIGDDVTIAENVSFINHGGDARVTKKIEKFADGRFFGRIKIGNNTFVGKSTIIMPGISIGNNCIVGSLSLISSSIPDNTVYAGVPAKFICTIEDYGDKLLRNNINYPRELESDRQQLEEYIKKHLPHTYKPVKK